MQDYISTPDWFGETSVYKPEMFYRVDAERFTFYYRCRKDAICDESLASGAFVEGLWERDVAEFFVAGSGPSYQEINISPTGAWWSCYFSDYRKPEGELRFEPEISARRESGLWEVEFSVKLTDLRPWSGLTPEQRKLSVSSILHDPEPHFFAWNHQSGGEPDFHRADLFRELLP